MLIKDKTLPYLGSSALHSFAFENEDVRLASTCRLNRHGQRPAVWRKLYTLSVGHLAIVFLSEIRECWYSRGAPMTWLPRQHPSPGSPCRQTSYPLWSAVSG